MPFAGDLAAARRALAALRELRLRDGDELILADNSGTRAGGRGVSVVPALAESLPVLRTQHGGLAGDRRVDPVPRRGLPRAGRPDGRVFRDRRRASRRRTRRRGRAARRTAIRSPSDMAPRAASSASRRTSPTPTFRVPSPPTCWSGRAAFEQVGGFYEGVRAAARTPTSAGVCRRPAGGSKRARRRARRAPLPIVAARAAPPVARVRGGQGLARSAVSGVQASACARASAARARPSQWRRWRRATSHSRPVPAFAALDLVLAIDELVGLRMSNRP